ncbi:hypothetical protein [Acrocarpospora catenulata]|uniref:hypothetical protein n=1 Tax=Acrocarpospora catenulata TaxID=2836182 RepID=UPI001BD9466E|nr:hypothetical protein [Acrocarpospora catenulata]
MPEFPLCAKDDPRVPVVLNILRKSAFIGGNFTLDSRRILAALDKAFEPAAPDGPGTHPASTSEAESTSQGVMGRPDDSGGAGALSELHELAHKRGDHAMLIGQALDLSQAKLGRAEAAIARIRELHQPLKRAGIMICTECSGWNGSRCRGQVTPHPCPTLDAVEALPDGSAYAREPLGWIVVERTHVGDHVHGFLHDSRAAASRERDEANTSAEAAGVPVDFTVAVVVGEANGDA